MLRNSPTACLTDPSSLCSRDNASPGTTTAWPSGLTIAASFDAGAALEWGTGMGKEFYAKGSNIQLGPGVCLARVPRNGRNFEYISGEDPYLGYQMVGPAVRGIQSQKVIANAKHYALNNQETNRGAVSENIDERTRFEMYYPPFRGAADNGVGSMMCSYNKVNGVWSCENPTTLALELKKWSGFDGFVMSDWGATHSASLAQGLDIEMPGAGYLNNKTLQMMLQRGDLSEADINDAALRILRQMYKVGVMDAPKGAWDVSKITANVTSAAAADSARRLAAASTVLLKNDGGVLPLKPTTKLAVIGLADDAAITHGGGSGSVVPSYIVKPLEGLKAAAPSASISYVSGADPAAAATAAAAADVAIVFAGTLSHEGGDRASLSLDDGCDDKVQCGKNSSSQNALIAAVAKANAKTVVVLSVPGAVLTPWSGDVAALLTNFMPGQQAGHAIADVLYGKVNPSARLPITFPNKENETEFSPSQWPGLPDPAKPSGPPANANYTEGLLVGYRYYEAHQIPFTTGFPFGHGLSYTSFSYARLRVDEATRTVAFDLTNAGGVAGAEVPQLYITFPDAAGEPPLNLKGFRKVTLDPSETVTVTFSLSGLDLSVWDATAHKWSEVKGTFKVAVGASSRDLKLKGTMDNL